MQEILTALAALRQYDGVRKPALVGLGLGGVMTLLARSLAGPLGATAVDLGGCRTDSDAFWLGPAYHPFIRKLGDVRAAVALASPSPLLIARPDAQLAKWARAVYRIRFKSTALRVVRRAARPADMASWVR